MNTRISRRSFIKRSALSTIGVAALPMFLEGLANAEDASGTCLAQKHFFFYAKGGPYLSRESAQQAAEAALNNPAPGNWHVTNSYASLPCAPHAPVQIPAEPVPDIDVRRVHGGLLWEFVVTITFDVYFCGLT